MAGCAALSGNWFHKLKKKKKNNSHDLRKPRCVYSNLGGEIRRLELPFLPAHFNNVIVDAFVITIKLFLLAHSF